MSSETSSVTRRPVAYISSSMARSRFASGVLRRAGCSSSSSISCTVSGFGSDLPTLGEASVSVGLTLTLPSAWRKEKNDFTAATLRATVASA